jgi:hypothetical protein
MKTISMMAVAAAISFAAVSFTATQAKAAKAEPVAPSEHYCLSYEAGSDCSFSSHAQCEAMASGIGGNCIMHQDEGNREDRPARR